MQQTQKGDDPVVMVPGGFGSRRVEKKGFCGRKSGESLRVLASASRRDPKSAVTWMAGCVPLRVGSSKSISPESVKISWLKKSK